jgi:small-conductance mechanosensitive channel
MLVSLPNSFFFENTMDTLTPITHQQEGWLGATWFGSLKNDYLAAMAAAVVAALLQVALASGMKDTTIHAVYLAGALLAYRGMLQLGYQYQLRGVRRGSRLLMLSFCLGFYTYGGEHDIIGNIQRVLAWLGVFILFVDLLAMQFQVSRWLIWSLVSLKIGAKFLLHLGWITNQQNSYLNAVGYVFIAVLFWELWNKPVQN